jgi:hypothetical protein
MAELIDLDVIRAAREAAGLEATPLRFGGDDFTVPNYSNWPAEAQEALIEGNLRKAFELILGPAQFDKFWSHQPSIGDMNDLMDELDRRVMAGRGNSPRSSSSSGSTSRPSTPTSAPSTASTSSQRASRKGPSARRPGSSKT